MSLPNTSMLASSINQQPLSRSVSRVFSTIIPAEEGIELEPTGEVKSGTLSSLVNRLTHEAGVGMWAFVAACLCELVHSLTHSLAQQTRHTSDCFSLSFHRLRRTKRRAN